jgi:c(7)-type cytochrome triheme protein
MRAADSIRLALVAVAAFILAFGLSISPFSLAGGAPKDLVYKGKTKNDVTFSHTSHVKKHKCASCHPKLFKTKKLETKFKMSDITAGKSCGTCHNGRVAFAVKQCAKCHTSKGKKPSAGSGCGSECKGCGK